jgi:hypothetical protein
MNSHRRAILQLLALGRVTPAQAERLLAAVNEGRETLWVLAAALVLACIAHIHLSQFVPGLIHIAQSVLPESLLSLHRALSLAAHLSGGML